MLVYFIQLWSVEMSYKALYEKKTRGLQAIEAVFCESARSIIEHPEIFAEIISFQAKWRTPAKWPELSATDKITAYPHCKGIENVPGEGLDSLLLPNLEVAVNKGELPENTPLMTLVVALAALFFGVPVILKHIPREQVEAVYREQLGLIWDGARKKYS
jgi:hypothetical protein